MSCHPAVQLSVILPAFNEGPAVVEAIERHAACLSKLGISYEIVIVNDGSSDNTLEVGEQAAKRYSGVRVLTNSKNRGQAASVLRGFAESHGTAVMHNGVDMPFDPGDIEHVWNEIGQGADVVVVPRENSHALANAIGTALGAPRRTLASTQTTIEQRFRGAAIARQYWDVYEQALRG